MRDQTHPPVVVLISSRSPAAYAADRSASSARGFIVKDELSRPGC